MINIYSLRVMESDARNDIRLMWIKDESKVFLDKEIKQNEIIFVYGKTPLQRHYENLEYQKEIITNLTSDLGIELRI